MGKPPKKGSERKETFTHVRMDYAVLDEAYDLKKKLTHPTKHRFISYQSLAADAIVAYVEQLGAKARVLGPTEKEHNSYQEYLI